VCCSDIEPVADLPIINLITDPKERKPYNYPYVHTWVLAHVGKIMQDYQASVGRQPLIPAGAALDHVPGAAPG
jgi:arylsulfatase